MIVAFREREETTKRLNLGNPRLPAINLARTTFLFSNIVDKCIQAIQIQ
jgi:hypothetical protein